MLLCVRHDFFFVLNLLSKNLILAFANGAKHIKKKFYFLPEYSDLPLDCTGGGCSSHWFGLEVCVWEEGESFVSFFFFSSCMFVCDSRNSPEVRQRLAFQADRASQWDPGTRTKPHEQQKKKHTHTTESKNLSGAKMVSRGFLSSQGLKKEGLRVASKLTLAGLACGG